MGVEQFDHAEVVYDHNELALPNDEPKSLFTRAVSGLRGLESCDVDHLRLVIDSIPEAGLVARTQRPFRNCCSILPPGVRCSLRRSTIHCSSPPSVPTKCPVASPARKRSSYGRQARRGSRYTESTSGSVALVANDEAVVVIKDRETFRHGLDAASQQFLGI